MMQRLDAPLIPDGDEAREWAENELAKPQYAEARPTFFDEMSRAIAQFFADLFSGDGGNALGPLAAIMVAALVVIGLVVALIVWGRPRRSFARAGETADLLGSTDTRTAAQLRTEAERQARGGDWDAAIVLRYRAIARGLVERDLLTPAPGATAQTLAREASAVFPVERAALQSAAASFDDVRYLRHPGTADRYRAIADTDERLRATRPELVHT